MTMQSDWPENVIARYLTVAGQGLAREDLTVDVERLDTVYGEPHGTRTTCQACQSSKDFDYTDYEHLQGHEARRDQSKEDARAWAQSHAETCRAIPKPA